jgi:hypothetical protein
MAVDLVAQRIMTPQEVAGYLIKVPDDPEGLRKWVEANAKQADEQSEQLLDFLAKASDARPQ